MKTKRIISLMLVFVMLVVSIPLTSTRVYAEEFQWTDEDHGLVFTYEETSDGGVIIKRIDPLDSGATAGSLDLVIPEEINLRPVTALDAWSASYNANLYKTVVFNKSVKSVPYHWGSFANATSITFPSDGACTEIAEEAFKGCSKLETVILPDSLVSIGTNAFLNCLKINSLDLGEGVQVIGESAFSGTAITELTLPDSLKTIGKKAFSVCANLATLTVGSGLETIGEEAFSNVAITSLDLPDSLNTIGKNAFIYCEDLVEVTWPQNNVQFSTVDGFSFCTSLPNNVLTSIPSTVTTIAPNAFSSCAFTEVIIPQSVESVGELAFAGNTKLESIVVAESDTPLTIGENAFQNSPKMVSKSVTLPERVSTLENNAFAFGYNTGNTFIIKNKNIVINGDPWGQTRWTTIIYPADLTEETSPTFIKYKEGREADPGDYPFTFQTESTEVYHTVSGTIPSGATIKALVNNQAVTPTMTGNAFTFDALENSAITLTISLDGYQDLTLTKSASAFTSDWDIGTITESNMTPLSTLGALSVGTTGAGGVNANVSIFDASGQLVASGTAKNSGSFTAQDLPEGTYTVIAFEKNAYVSGITSLAGLEALGLDSSSYARTTATVTRLKTTEIELDVPTISQTDFSEIVDEVGTFVTIDRTLVTKNMDFYGKVYYKMAGNNSASEIKVVIPSDLTVTSVTSGSKKYNMSSVYSGGIVTIDGLSGDEAKSGTIFIGLKAQETGHYCISASVGSTSGATVPVGSADFTVEDIVLQLKENIISSRSVSATVWAEPGKTIKIRLGSGEEYTFGTTNKLGYISDILELPSNTPTGTSHTVIAKVTDAAGTHTAMDSVYYMASEIELQDFSFIHANKKYDLVKGGINKSGGFYTYVADGKEATKNWTFSTSLVSSSELTGNIILNIQMMDGSIRNEILTPISTETTYDGKIKTHFAANIYIETAGNHIFDDALVPEGFEIDYTRDEPEFTTDEAYTAYLEELVEAERERRKKDIDPDLVQSWTEEDIDIFYNYFICGPSYYHLSQNPETVDEYNAMSPEDQAAVRNLEQAMDDLIGAWQEVAGDAKPMYEYDTYNDYVKENWWDYEVLEGPSFIPSENLDERFTLSDDGSFAYTDDGREMIKYSDDDTTAEHIVITAKEPVMSKDTWDALWSYMKSAQQSSDFWVNYLEDLQTAGKLGPKMTKFLKYFKPASQIFGAAAGMWDTYQTAEELKEAQKQTEKLQFQYDDMKREVKRAEHAYGAGKITMDCLKAMRAEEMAAYELARAADRRDTNLLNSGYVGMGALVITGVTLFVGGPIGIVLAAGCAAADYVGFNAVNMSNVDVANAIAAYDRAHLERKIGCADEETRAKYRLKAIFDPSGFVYEAVEGNRVEGATATLVYSDTSSAWDASEYDQINPQTTDEDGHFAWDVPTGTWKVKVEKAGYETAFTDALEVPPPRMDVRIPIVTTKAPEVEFVNVYSDYIEVIFTQYMNIDDASDIVATIDGAAASNYNWQNAEESPSGEKYSKVVRIPTPSGTKVGDKLGIKISSAKNYADIPMASPYEEEREVTHRPTEIELSYEDVINMKPGEKKGIVVRVKDENGDYMEGLTVEALIDNTYLAEIAASGTTDANGAVTLNAEALLPGLTSATFKVAGTTLSKTIDVKVEPDPVRAKRPTAKIGDIEIGEGAPVENNITVEEGEMLSLASATDGAKVYYMIGDNTPCTDCVNRIEYKEPIEVNENMRLTVIAYKNGLEYSEKLILNITVKEKANYTITYDLDGGTLNGKTGKITEVHKSGTTITIPDAPEKEGYDFDYWQGSAYNPGDQYQVTENHTFTAIWKAKSGGDSGDSGDSGSSGSGDSDSGSGSGGSGSGGSGTGGSGSSTGSGEAADTGDENNMLFWIILIGLAATSLVATVGSKKCRSRE